LEHFEGLKQFNPIQYTPQIDLNDLNVRDQELAKNGELDKNRELVKKQSLFFLDLHNVLVPERPSIFEICLQSENY